MKKVRINFYSYRPRLKVDFFWETDTLPNIGDTIKVPEEFISHWDKKCFPKWRKEFQMDFRVKERVFIVRPPSRHWGCDVYIKLEWNDEEQKEVDKYLNQLKTTKINQKQHLNC